jgi:hypothetical protein
LNENSFALLFNGGGIVIGPHCCGLKKKFELQILGFLNLGLASEFFFILLKKLFELLLLIYLLSKFFNFPKLHPFSFSSIVCTEGIDGEVKNMERCLEECEHPKHLGFISQSTLRRSMELLSRVLGL